MSYTLDQDLEITYGEDYYRSFQLFGDTRLKRWRGPFNDNFVYKVGDGTKNLRGEAFVSVLQSQRAEPGSPGTTPFWSPMVPMDLAEFAAQTKGSPEGKWGGFSREAEIESSKGKITVVVLRSDYAALSPGSSAHYYVELTSPLGSPSYPIKGTLLLRAP